MGGVFLIIMNCEKIIQLIEYLKDRGFEMILSIPSDGVLYSVWNEPERKAKKNRLLSGRRFGGNQD